VTKVDAAERGSKSLVCGVQVLSGAPPSISNVHVQGAVFIEITRPLAAHHGHGLEGVPRLSSDRFGSCILSARSLSPTRGSARAGLWLPDGTRLRLLRYFILVFVSTH
jgi:hypothetical protein